MRNDDLYSPTWTPDRCPNRNCRFFNRFQKGWSWRHYGYYQRRAEPRRLRRFRCNACGVTFSPQTFSTTYWLRRPDIYLQLPTRITSGACKSQIAFDMGVAPSTIQRQIDRLGRHCILFHAKMMEKRPRLADIAIDGFVTFEHSQYHPFHFHLAVDRATSFMPYFTDSEVRRSGRMTAHQKRRRAELERIRGRPDPRAVRKDVRELLEYVTRGQDEMTIHSDDHGAYRWAIEGLGCDVRHVVTSSQDIRDRLNDLFEINLSDLLTRHWLCEHKRETIAYAKRRNCSAYRMAIALVQRNYVKPRRARGEKATPAQLLGLCQERLTVEELLARRLFVDEVDLPPRWARYYWGEVDTRALRINRRHELRYAR
ncbi:hypothetical protein GF314_13085 [bacterium]|nr:hypothetical protein [bacterium]